MKNIVTMITSTILGVITLMIVMTLQGRMNRSMEIESTLPEIVEEVTVDRMEQSSYSIDEADVYFAELAQNLTIAIDSDSNIKIEIMKLDVETGALSIRVTEEFRHPNGRVGTVDCERTVILDK